MIFEFALNLINNRTMSISPDDAVCNKNVPFGIIMCMVSYLFSTMILRLLHTPSNHKKYIKNDFKELKHWFYYPKIMYYHKHFIKFIVCIEAHISKHKYYIIITDNMYCNQ